MTNYYNKYLKYKNKYLQLKGGANLPNITVHLNSLDGKSETITLPGGATNNVLFARVRGIFLHDIYHRLELFNEQGEKLQDDNNQHFNNGDTINIIIRALSGDELIQLLGPNAVIDACKAGNSEELKALVGAQVDLDVHDHRGCTPAHWAAYNGHAECLRVLHGAKKAMLSVPSDDGRTPAHMAAYNGYVDCLKVLCEANREILSVRDQRGYTPAHYAAERGHAKYLEVLHEAGVEFGVPSHDGRTPAHMAVMNGHAECLRVLLDADREILSVRDNTGASVAHYAAEMGHAKCLEVLREAGVDITQ